MTRAFHDDWRRGDVSLSKTDSQVHVQPSGNKLAFTGMGDDTKGGDAVNT